VGFEYHKDLTDATREELHIPKVHASSHYAGSTDPLDFSAMTFSASGMTSDNLQDAILEAYGAGSDYWQRAGTTISPINAGDTIALDNLTLINTINEFSTDTALSGDSDDAVPTEKAVKAYVDAQITAEDFWDRSGTTIEPNTANDNLDMGSGTITTTGALSAGAITCTTINTGTGARELDQDVISGASPTFDATNFSDGGTNAIVTLTQETNWDNHLVDDGADHSFIDQSVISGASPTFDGTNFTGIPTGALDDTYVNVDGTVPMTAHWDIGNFTLTANGITIDGTFTDGTLSISGGDITNIDDLIGATDLKLNSTAEGNITMFQSSESGENRSLRQYGYISGSGIGVKYIDWAISDSTDNFELTREDTNIGAFDIKMPLEIGSYMSGNWAEAPLLFDPTFSCLNGAYNPIWNISPTVNMDASTIETYSIIHDNSAVTATASGGVGNSYQLFLTTPTLKSATAGVKPPVFSLIFNLATVQGDGAAVGNSSHFAFADGTMYSTINSGTMTVPSAISFTSQMRINADAGGDTTTITESIGFRMVDVVHSGSGSTTVGTQVGLSLPNMVGATNSYGIRSAMTSDSDANLLINHTGDAASVHYGVFNVGDTGGGDALLAFKDATVTKAIIGWDNSASLFTMAATNFNTPLVTVDPTNGDVDIVAGDVVVTAGNLGIGVTATQPLDVNGITLLRDALYFTQADGAEKIDSSSDGYLDLFAGTAITTSNVLWVKNAIYFTQGDGAEKIDSDADNYLDIYAGVAIRTHPILWVQDAIYFTQADGAEKIDSAGDGEMDYTAGTSHDFIIGATEQISLIDGVLQPTTTNDIDLGTTSLFYKDAYLARIFMEDVNTYFDNNSGDIDIYTAANKTFELQQTVWDDYVTPLGPNNWNGASNNPTLTKLGDDGDSSQGVYAYVWSDDDEALITIQMPHTWKEGTDIYPHIHFMCTSDVSPAEYFGIEFEYWWADINEDFPANTTLELIDISTAENSNKMHQIANVTASAITGSGHTLSSVLNCRIKRVAVTTSGLDNYADGVAILDFDVHHEIDTMGSRQIGTK